MSLNVCLILENVKNHKYSKTSIIATGEVEIMEEKKNRTETPDTSTSPESPSDELTYRTATGPIPYTMLNDYMFRAILQKNELVLRGLIGSLLHLEQDAIESVTITNPITLGEKIDSKTFILDIYLRLNNDTSINLEMQVLNEGNWTDRSLSYLCRTYDKLQVGEDYIDSSRAIQIGILDYTLFPDKPEFYAEYRMMNVKTHHIYSDKLQLHVLELSQIKLATEEDKKYGIDRWARLFKSTTWEEIRMIIAENKYLNEAAEEMYRLNAEEKIRQQCWARAEYQRRQKRAQRRAEEQKQRIEEAERKLAESNHAIENLQREKQEQQEVIASKDVTIVEQQQALDEKDRQIEQFKAQLAKLQKNQE